MVRRCGPLGPTGVMFGHHGRDGDRQDPLDVVVDSLRRRTAKQLALDRLHDQTDLDDGVDIGW